VRRLPFTLPNQDGRGKGIPDASIRGGKSCKKRNHIVIREDCEKKPRLFTRGKRKDLMGSLSLLVRFPWKRKRKKQSGQLASPYATMEKKGGKGGRDPRKLGKEAVPAAYQRGKEGGGLDSSSGGEKNVNQGGYPGRCSARGLI